MALFPITQTRIGVDMACRSVIHPICAPGHCKAVRAAKAAIRIIVATQHHTGKWQALQRHWRPAFEDGAQLFALRVTRCHEECSLDTVGIARMGCPCRSQDTAQTMGYQNHRLGCGQNSFFQLDHPITAQGAHPLALLYSGVAVQCFPTALPMGRARVLPTGKQQYRCGGGTVLGFHVLHLGDACDHLLGEGDESLCAFG